MRRRTLHPSTIVQLLVAGLLVLAATAVVAGVRGQATPSDIERVVPGVASEGDGGSPTFVSCQRTLPERSTITSEVVPTTIGSIRSQDVIECPDLFDQRFVTYTGEIVGDILQRPNGAWVLVNDDAYALELGPLHAAEEFAGGNSGLSVWLDGDLADVVDQPGNARWRGDVIRVSGILHRTDPADGGSLTIRASEAQVVAQAQRIEPQINVPQAIAAVVLSAIAAVLYGVERRRAATR